MQRGSWWLEESGTGGLMGKGFMPSASAAWSLHKRPFQVFMKREPLWA